MTTKILKGTYSAGYSLSAAYSTLSITGTGFVGGTGVLAGAPASVFNEGTVDADAAGATGIRLADGGSVTNGSSKHTAAMIAGSSGVRIEGALGAVTNFGAIQGAYAGVYAGVYLQQGGVITNGAAADTTALIAGQNGIDLDLGSDTISNFGTIKATSVAGRYYAIRSDTAAVILTNGSTADTGALIDGYRGVQLLGTGSTVANFGTIEAQSPFVPALYVDVGVATNGSAGDRAALINGVQGLRINGVATAVNFGTIQSTSGGKAFVSNTADGVLIVEAGCAFIGGVYGGGGSLVLASGVGTLSGLLSAGGTVVVSGSMATTTFQNFGTVEIGAGASFTDKGTVTLASGQAIESQGSLVLGAKVTSTGTLATDGGTLQVIGAVTGAGVADIDGGVLDLGSSFTQNVAFTGKSGVLKLARSQTYAGTISGFSKSGKTSLDLADIGFVNAHEAAFTGTSKSGVLTVSDGTHTATITLKGDYRGETFKASSDGAAGTIVTGATAPLSPSPALHPFIAAMAALGPARAHAIHVDEPRIALSSLDLTAPRPHAV